MFGAQGLWAGRDLYRATPTATQDLGLYGLIRKIGTHVPQWGSNPQLKDHQIFEPDALYIIYCICNCVYAALGRKWIFYIYIYILILSYSTVSCYPLHQITSYYSQSDDVNIINIYKIFADNFTVGQCSTIYILLMLLWIEVDIYINNCPIAPPLATFCIKLQYIFSHSILSILYKICTVNCCMKDFAIVVMQILTWFAVWRILL
jgi:hypothetical protein